jgi:hypothetical protein
MQKLLKVLMLFLCYGNVLFSVPHYEDWKHYQKWALQEQQNQNKFPGWCSRGKAQRIMDILLNNSSDVCVEVGVYGGSSFFPIAATLAFKKQGMAYAIDPWENTPCLEGYQEDEDKNIFNYWGKIDLVKVMQKFINSMHENGLDANYTLLRLTSNEAALLFEDSSINFLHIDGNHSELASMNDVVTWLPKVKSGGIICFDDAWWASTQKAIKFMKESCDLMKKDSSSQGQYIFLRKR